MTMPALPPGFEMDAPPALPPGFELDSSEPVEFKGGKAQIPGPVRGMNAPAATATPVPELRGMSLSRKVLGGLEAALSVVTGLTGGSVGAAGGLVEGLAKIVQNGKFGTAAGANEVEATMAQRAGDLTYEPRTDAGQAIMQNYVAPVGAALAPLTGHGGEMGMLQSATSPAKAAGMQAGREAKAAVGNAGLDAAAGMVKVNPQKLANAGAAVDAGMDVPLHTIGDRGAVVKGTGEAMGQIPLSGSKHESNIKAFNKQVIAHINPEETSAQLTPQVMDRALKTAGKTIGENMRSVEVPQADLAPAMNSLRDGLATATVDAEKVVRAYLAQIDVKASENGGVIPGAALRELDTKIGEQLRSSGGQHPDIESRIAELQDAIRDAAEGRMTPEMADATKAARQRYAKTMSLVPAYADIRKQGYLDPGKLMTLVGKSPLSKKLMATGNGGAWQDLAAAGELVQPEGSALRGRLIGGGAGIGAGGLYAATGSMTPAGAVAGAAGVLGTANLYNRVGPKIVKKLVERERKRGAPPPEAPPPELTTEPGAGGPGPAPRGGTVLPAPDDGPLGLAGPDLTTSPGAGGIELPRELSPAEQALSARAPVLDELTIGERAPSRIIKSRKGEVERRAMKDVPAVPGRPDVPEQMNVGAPAEVGRTAADNAALIADQTVLAREKQGLSMAPGKEAPPPVGEAKEVGTYDPRLAEIEKVRAKTDNPAVRDALAKREAEVKRSMKAEDAARKREQDADALDAAAKQTTDPEIKATLRAEADKLREKIPTGEVKEGLPADKAPKQEKIPVGKTKEGNVEPEVTEISPERVEGGEPIPKGEATEVEPVPVGQADELLPVGEAAEVLPVGEVSETLPAGDAIDGPPAMDRVPMPPAPKPRMIERGLTTLPAAKIRKVAKEHGLGTKDMERAKAVAAALEKDESAVVAATTKGHTPAAFDAEIERINRTPEMTNASQPIQAAESSPRPEPRGQDAATRTEQPRPDGAATARADKPKADVSTRQGLVAALKKEGLNATDMDPGRRTGGRVLVVLDAIPYKVDAWAELKNGEWKYDMLGTEGRGDVKSISQREAVDAFKAKLEDLTAGAKPAAPKPAPQPMLAAPRVTAAPTKPAPKPLIARKNSEILADLNKQIDAEARYGAGGPERITLKSGGTTQVISNTAEGVAKWRAEAAKSYGFKDTKVPKPAPEKKSGIEGTKVIIPRDKRVVGSKDDMRMETKAWGGELSKRSPKTVVQDFVSDGDFENAQALAEHYGIDIKAGMDAWQKQAYQDWQDGPKPEPELPKAPEPVPQPPKAAPEPVQATHPDPAANMAFDEWAKHQYAANEYKDGYLRRAGGDEKRAALMATVSGGSKEMPIKDLLAQAKQRYAQHLLELPRDATISLDVYDALPPMLQTEAARHFFDIDTRLTKRTQNEVAVRIKGQEAAEAPIRQRLVDADAEIKRLDSKDGPETQKVRELRLKRAKLEQELYEMRRLY